MPGIYILTHEFRPKRGGAGMVCEQLAETLHRTGHEVTVWAPEYVDRDTGFHPGYGLKGIPGLKGTLNPGSLLAIAKQVLRERKGELRDAVVYLGEPGPVAGFFYLTLFCKPFWKRLILTLHGSEIERYRANPVSGWLFKRLLKKVDTVHVLSTYNADKLTAWIPEISSKLVKGYGMLLPRETLPDLDEKQSIQNRAKVQLLCVGRIHPRKGQHELLQAVSTLSSDIQRNLKVKFVGQFVKDTYYRRVAQIAESCEAEIEFTGGLPDEALEAEYLAADIFALTSVPYRASIEGLGLVYLEASRHGLPVLANRIGGVPDVVIHGRNGYLSEPGDIKQLAANLEMLVRNPVLRRQLGYAGREMVAEHTWEDVVRKLFPDAS